MKLLTIILLLLMSDTKQILMDRNSADSWRIINDSVMGGLSKSSMEMDNEHMVFSGIVSLKNNGGFASVRSPLKEYDFSNFSGLKLKVKGDGKTYSVSMKQTYNFTGYFYTINFNTDRDEWIEVQLPFDKFKLKYYGRTIDETPDIPLDKMKEVSLLIGEKQEGRFKILIDEISLY